MMRNNIAIAFCHLIASVALYFSVDTLQSGLNSGDYLADVTSEGLVDLTTAGETITSCPIDMRYFPFDCHKCQLSITNWVYPSKLVQLNNASHELDLSFYNENSQWKVTSTAMSKTSYRVGSDFYEQVNAMMGR